jgi:hypothetical protein
VNIKIFDVLFYYTPIFLHCNVNYIFAFRRVFSTVLFVITISQLFVFRYFLSFMTTCFDINVSYSESNCVAELILCTNF